MKECMEELEKFIVQPDSALNDPLIRAGMAHAQFETIHPFLDGNGRMGRLLIVLMLINEGALDDPWLCVSLPVKKSREEYYERLQSTRTTGDWTVWLLYFLRIVAEAAGDARKRPPEKPTPCSCARPEKIRNQIGAQKLRAAAVHQRCSAFPSPPFPGWQSSPGFPNPRSKARWIA